MTATSAAPELQNIERIRAASNAWVYRSNPGGVSRIDECFEHGVLATGWSLLPGAKDAGSQWEVRRMIREKYHHQDQNDRRAGAQATHLWRFVSTIQIGDVVLLPVERGFHVGIVTGEAAHRPELSDPDEDDWSWMRPVDWLTERSAPIKRRNVETRLQTRLKARGTSAAATDLIEPVALAYANHIAGVERTVAGDLRDSLVQTVRQSLVTGTVMDNFGFEHLVAQVLRELGAQETHVVARSKDVGADIVAVFRIADISETRVYVQCKQHEGLTSSHAIDQVLNAAQLTEDAPHTWVVTSGEVSDATAEYAAHNGVEVIDGTRLAELVVDHGLLRGTVEA